MAVSVSIKRKSVRRNLKRYTDVLHLKAKQVWNEAIGIYIQTVAIRVATHQDTGMSLASLFPTARKVRQGNMPGLTPKIWGRATVTSIDGVRYKGHFKTAGLGERLGEKCSTINYGIPSRPKFSFSFEIQVYQYLLNEFGFGRTTALKSMRYGRMAMQDYLQFYASKAFPKLSEYFTPITEVIV